MPELQKKLKLIRLDCGEVCDTSIKASKRGKYYDYISKRFDCLNLFESPMFDEPTITDRNYEPPS